MVSLVAVTDAERIASTLRVLNSHPVATRHVSQTAGTFSSLSFCLAVFASTGILCPEAMTDHGEVDGVPILGEMPMKMMASEDREARGSQQRRR